MPDLSENSKLKNSYVAHTSHQPQQQDGSGSSTSSESEESSSLSPPLLAPPDGGWGWVVVLASFLVHMIADGCAFSFGVLYVELLHHFKESKGKTAWVGSLFVSVPLITGPIASALTNKYGCRATTIMGAIIASIGFIVSSFASSIEQLCLTFGLIAGFGLSMVYVPAVVIVAYYFEKKRAFATGVAVAGSGIGTFVFAPLTEFLIEVYTWKGAVLILGGMMLNMLVCGALFRPLVSRDGAPNKNKKNACKQLSLESRLSYKSSSSGHHDDHHNDHHHVHYHKVPNGTAGGAINTLNMHENTGATQAMLTQPVIHSLVQFPTYLSKEVLTVSPDLLRHLDKSGKTFQDLLADPDFLDRYYATQSMTDMSQVKGCGNGSSGSHTPIAENPDAPLLNGNLHNSDSAGSGNNTTTTNTATTRVNYPNSKRNKSTVLRASNGDVSTMLLHQQYLWRDVGGRHMAPRAGQASSNWPMQRKDIFYRGSLVRPGLLHVPKRAASCPDIVMRSLRTSQTSAGSRQGLLQLLRFSHEVKLVLREMMDIAILRSIVFVYFCVSCMVLYMWYDVPYVYCPDKAIVMGISEDRASYLVAIIGITSTVGQIVVGLIGDRPGVDALLLYNALTSVAGVTTMLVPLIVTFTGLAVYAGSYGFFISGNYALTTIILVDLVGMEKLTNAYGLVMLAEGLANLVGPPLAGFISDYTGSYNETFYIAGAGILGSGLMLFAIPWLRRCDRLAAAARAVQATGEVVESSSTSGGSALSQDNVLSATHTTTTLPLTPHSVASHSSSSPSHETAL